MESVYFGQILAVKFDLFEKGMEIHQHKHEYDHISILTSGAVSVWVDDGPENKYVAPNIICIKRDSRHKIISRSDNTMWYCIFALRDIDGNPSDQYDIVNLPKAGGFPRGSEPAISNSNKIIFYNEKIKQMEEHIEQLNLILKELSN